jgi:hypothetical protein
VGSEVVGLGAWCDYVTEDEYRARLGAVMPWPAVDKAVDKAVDPAQPPRSGRWSAASPQALEEVVENFRRGASFDVHEFAVLGDGRRITLHTERGFSVSGPPDAWAHLTAENLEADVRTTVLPDDGDDEHPWEWLVSLLRAHGIDTSPEQLRTVPYAVEFSHRLTARLRSLEDRHEDDR